MIPAEEIEEFLKGSDPEQYIVSVEFDYVSDSIYKIIEDPIKGKIVKRDTFIPFAWVGDLRGLNFYQGSKGLQKEAMSKYGIVIEKLKTEENKRLEEGLSFMVKSLKGYRTLLQFFRDGGIDPYGEKAKEKVLILPPIEQFLIQKEKRLFKGFSTIVMAAALKFNSKYTQNKKIFSLETEKKWIIPVKKKLVKYKNYSEIIYSKCEMRLINMSLCSVYKNLPNITPDLIYLDGPDPDAVKSKIFNLNYENTNNPVSADILLYEYRLKPGAIIVVDGRPNNVVFLKNHLKRKYKFEFQRLYSRSIFVLIE